MAKPAGWHSLFTGHHQWLRVWQRTGEFDHKNHRDALPLKLPVQRLVVGLVTPADDNTVYPELRHHLEIRSVSGFSSD